MIAIPASFSSAKLPQALLEQSTFCCLHSLKKLSSLHFVFVFLPSRCTFWGDPLLINSILLTESALYISVLNITSNSVKMLRSFSDIYGIYLMLLNRTFLFSINNMSLCWSVVLALFLSSKQLNPWDFSVFAKQSLAVPTLNRIGIKESSIRSARSICSWF